jgi:DNA transposition AAA+ family ATPase
MYPKPHPAKAILAERRITLRRTSAEVGLNAHTLGRVLNGYQAAYPALRARLAAFLEVPEADLFHRDSETGGAAS